MEAIDKKQNFPKPRVQQGDAASSSQSASQEEPSQTSPRDSGKSKLEDAPKTISPELRKLLSREVEVLPRNVVQKKGDGFNADARN